MKKHYPKWLYSRDRSTIVQDPAEQEALGAGWYESPADVPLQTQDDEPEPPAPAPAKKPTTKKGK